MDQKNKNLSEELNRMKVLGGLLKESMFDSDDIDYGEIALNKRIEAIKKIESQFEKNKHSSSADWGGIPTWIVKGDSFEGYFIIDDSEFNDDYSFSLMKRTYNPEIEESVDETLFTTYLTPERFGNESNHDGDIDELIEKALKIKFENSLNEEEIENNSELPQNKKNINTKLSTKRAIVNALYKILQVEKVEGRYRDESWEGVLNFTQALNGVGAETELVNSNYEGHGEVRGYESLPTRKIYKFDVSVRDKNGKVITIPFKVTCAFVGQTGTMSDEVYELTYYAIA